VTVGQSVVLDARASTIPAGCTLRWDPAGDNPGPSTLVSGSTLTPQVTPWRPGAHRFTLTASWGTRRASSETVVHAFSKPVPTWPDRTFVVFEDGVPGDNTTTSPAGRLYVFAPSRHPDVKGPVTEVWLDVNGERLRMTENGDGTHGLWVPGASLEADHHYWVFVAANRFALAPVPALSVTAVAGGAFELEASLPLARAFGGGADASYELYPDPMNEAAGAPTISKQGATRFRVDGPLAAPQRFHLVAETASYRSLPALVTLPPPAKPAARPDLGVIYQIYVKQFADGDGDGVGDLGGLRTKLDYLASELGVNTLLLMPIFATPGSAGWGYSPADYTKVHPDYGTTQDLALLVKDAHEKGLRVLLDLPVNHVHRSYAACAQAVGNPASPTSSWFHFFDGNRSWFGWDYKDDGAHSHFFAARQSGDVAMNLDDPDARAEMLGNVRHVLDPSGDGNPGDGVDGLRLDYVKGPSLDFWRALAALAATVNPEVALYGEAWTGAEELGDYLRDAGLNGVFDFPFHYALRDGLKRGRSDSLYAHLGELRTHYAGGFAVPFTSNHDVGRLLSDLAAESVGKAMAAASIVLTAPGNPMLFFGDELGLVASRDESADRKNGGAFPWGGGDRAQTTEPAGAPLVKPPTLAEQRQDPSSLLAHHQALLKLRKQLTPLHDASAPGYRYDELGDPSLFAMVRPSGGERVLVIVNLGPDARTIAFAERSASTRVYGQGLGSDTTIGAYGTKLYVLP
jgi:glycosidase